MDNLELDTALFNQYHALLVNTGKDFCKKTKPKCEQCPLSGMGGVEEWLPDEYCE